ncbi:conjugal transfer protein TraL [Pseudoduganella umbonata]|uniref:Conjugal transfer protein TraL n=1 Tax=Pseudoduganella umbonata TaxID=864828 RepID=A0A4P8HHP7_9BURK|nr:conjugal transfer protein TraL [Pseudoduganella umbonata]MBB3221674.1 hypothetical protein [Pseudoduganella umbonata]QCP09099.1 conjugal transfer protein TraL [Pseudoduganella umbonata]
MDTNTVHLMLQGRGGVGKSLGSALLAQYLLHRDVPISCYDTDPVNDTFSQYGALGAKRTDILGPDKNINPRAFDSLVDALLWDDKIAVIDNGASTFVPLMAYLVENHVLSVLRDAGRPVLLHCVLTGGQAFDDTQLGLETVLSAHQAPVVLWINEYFGPVRRDGRGFEDSILYQRHADRIRGIVRLERANADTFGKDVELMLQRKLTFAEALNSDHFGIMPRQRLKMTRDMIFNQLAAIGL